jgi:hypothetical protein
MPSRHTRFMLLRWIAITMAAIEVYIHAVVAPSHLQGPVPQWRPRTRAFAAAVSTTTTPLSQRRF